MKNLKHQILDKTIIMTTEKKGFKRKNKEWEIRMIIYLKLTKKIRKAEKQTIMQIKQMVIYKSIFGNMWTSLMGNYKKYQKK